MGSVAVKKKIRHKRYSCSGAMIEIQGHAPEIFLTKLQNELPALAKIDTIDCKNIAVIPDDANFAILPSAAHNISAKISADLWDIRLGHCTNFHYSKLFHRAEVFQLTISASL